MSITIKYRGTCEFVDGEDAVLAFPVWKDLVKTANIKLDESYYNCKELQDAIYDPLELVINLDSGRVLIYRPGEKGIMAKGMVQS